MACSTGLDGVWWPALQRVERPKILPRIIGSGQTFSFMLPVSLDAKVCGWPGAVEIWLGLIQPRQKAFRASCQSNLKQVGLALSLYAQDFSKRFPPATVAGPAVPGWRLGKLSGNSLKFPGLPVGWADAIQPYMGSESLYNCPSETSPIIANPPLSGYTDYWYNGRLSGVSRKSVASPTSVLLLGEGSDGTDITDATYSKTSLPPNWLTDQSKPPWRHLGGANYLHADGHVAWIKPNQISTAPGQPHTFAIK